MKREGKSSLSLMKRALERGGACPWDTLQPVEPVPREQPVPRAHLGRTSTCYRGWDGRKKAPVIPTEAQIKTGAPVRG